MALSRRTGRSRFTLVLLVLSSVTVLTLDFRGAGFVSDLRGVASTAFDPVRSAASTVFEPLTNGWNGIVNYDDLADENERLRAEIAELEGDAVRGVDAIERAQDIEDATGLPTVRDLGAVLARVVSGPISNFDHTIEVNRGTDHGISEGMPVVTGAGLVGRVVQATGGRSVVRLITDPSFEVGVRHVRSREVGISHGNGDGELLTVNDIAQGVVVEPGDSLTTSGIDRSIFPADVPVGTVTEVDASSSQLAQELRLEPFADLGRLSYVSVLQWQPPP